MEAPGRREKGSTSVQDIFFSSLADDLGGCGEPRRGSRIPVRRDSSSPPSLPSSGRSTPVHRPAMKRESSSPPGLMSVTSKARPPIAPKPAKVVQKLSPPTFPAVGRFSKIPRPDQVLKKWESTSKLEMKRTSSDLNETTLRKRALTQSCSMNLPSSESSSNLSRLTSGSTSNLNRATSGSTSSLRSAPAFTRSVSASFAALPSLSRSSSTSSFSNTDLSKGRQGKTEESKSGGRRQSKPRKEQEVERLKEELEATRRQVEDLRGAVEQKENIAKIAVDNNMGKSEDYEVLYKTLGREHAKLAGSAKDWEGKILRMEVELKDARDTADLLEFRLLELEQRESRERTPEIERKTDLMSDKSVSLDSGCSSQTTLEDLLEVQKDFRNEKVADTKVKLHQLMDQIPEAGGKSLLLQTVALFETLLSKIKLMKEEAEGLRADKAELEAKVAQQGGETERALLAEAELIQTCEELEEVKMRLVQAETQLEQTRMETDKIGSVNQQVQDRQDKIAGDLRREVEQAQARLDTERQGFLEEKLMYQTAIEKCSQQERMLKEQQALLAEQQQKMQEQQAALVEQTGLVAELERSSRLVTNRRISTDSAEYQPNKVENSSGVSSDVSDSENSEGEHQPLRRDGRDREGSRERRHDKTFLSVEEQFTESGIFEEVSSLEHSLITSPDDSGLERSVLERSSLERSSLERSSLERIVLERSDQELSSLERSSLERSSLEPSVLERSGLEQIGLERIVKKLSELDGNSKRNENNTNTASTNKQERKEKTTGKDEYGSCEELEKIHSAKVAATQREELDTLTASRMATTQREELDTLTASRMATTQREELDTLTTRLKEMEQKWEALYLQHQQVVEERCELEEAENDSRLKAQTLELQYAGALERSQIIKDELILERQTSEDLRGQMEELLSREERNMEDMDALQSHLQEQEQLIRELEDREAFYADQLRLLDMGVKISNWWKAWAWIILPQTQDEESGVHREEGPRGGQGAGTGGATALTYTPPEKEWAIKEVLTQHLGSMNQLESQYKIREESLCTQLEFIELEFESFLDQLLNILFGHVQVSNKREEVVHRVRGLVEAEASLKRQISDLEKKEAVYSKTIQEADLIMARVEYSAQEQIKTLQQEKHELKEALWSLQQKNRSSSQENRTSSQEINSQAKEELNTIRELETKLRAVEESEAALKIQVQNLESSKLSLSEQLAAREEQNNLEISSQLQKEVEIRVEVERMREEREALVLEVTKLREVENILTQLRRSEEELRTRLKMMEGERGEEEEEDKQESGAKVEEEERRSGEGEEERKPLIETSNLTVTTIKNGNDGEENNMRKVNTLRLEVKSLDDNESRTSDLESSEHCSRFEPYSRGNSMDRELSEEPDSRKQRSRTDSGNPDNYFPRTAAELRSQQLRDGSGSPDYRSEVSSGKFSNFYRYKSMRDHTGRFFLLVKIR